MMTPTEAAAALATIDWDAIIEGSFIGWELVAIGTAIEEALGHSHGFTFKTTGEGIPTAVLHDGQVFPVGEVDA